MQKPKELTKNQTWCIEALRSKNLNFLADITEHHWVRGKTYYIDKRINVDGLRRKFEQRNREALRNK